MSAVNLDDWRVNVEQNSYTYNRLPRGGFLSKVEQTVAFRHTRMVLVRKLTSSGCKRTVSLYIR